MKILKIITEEIPMIKIMFVCHGNICRSPMAEFVLRDMVNKMGFSKDFQISSSATSCEELGNPVYPPVRSLLKEKGIDTLGKFSVQLKKSDYEKYDLFIGMDSANIRNMHRIFGSDPENKIRKMMDFTSRGGDVADPWYTRDFNRTYEDIYDACKCIVDMGF